MNELVVKSDNAVVLQRSSIPSEHEMMVYHTMAEHAISSKLYPGEKAAVMMKMLSARELGIPPMQALNGGLNIIQGKVEISARMMSALIRKAGHRIQVKESTDLECVLVGKRADTNETQTASFSVADAQKAGLVKPGGGWVKFPKDMCFARALSRLARQLFSDVIGMGYIEGEISYANKKGDSAEILEDDVIEDEVVEIKNPDETLNNFINLFQVEDRALALEYLKIVMKHFQWTEVQAIQELLKDQKKLFDKFNTWKIKVKQ